MRRSIWILLLVLVLAAPAAAIDFVIDGSLPGGGGCKQIGISWDDTVDPPVCEALVFILELGNSLSITAAELKLTYISLNYGDLVVQDDGQINVDNGLGVTNRGNLYNHGTIFSPDGTHNEAGSYIFNDGLIEGGLNNAGTVVNMCPGSILPPAGPDPALQIVTLTALESGPWSWCEGGASYDVVTGDLQLLRSSDGDFTQATLSCLADDLAATSVSAPDPGPGEGRWLLVRPSGSGLYESGGGAQLGERDGEISAAPAACP